MSSHAEVARVWPRDGHVRITGHLHGTDASPAARWEFLLVLREHGDRLRYGTTVDGDAFDVRVPVDDLALDGLHRATWDLFLAHGPGEEEVLRIGRHLDDIRGKKKIFVFPQQAVTSDEDGTLVRPFYTINDNLSVECVPGDVELRPDEFPVERREWAQNL